MKIIYYIKTFTSFGDTLNLNFKHLFSSEYTEENLSFYCFMISILFDKFIY